MDSFNKYFSDDRRHRKPLGTTDVDRHYRRKSLNIVPDLYKAKMDANPKIEQLKKQPGKFVCNAQDLQYIQRVFLHDRPPNKNEMKMLGGKLGIKFFWDTTLNNWVIQK